MLLLHDIDENIGGLEVVPDTANDASQQFLAKHRPSSYGDFITISK